MNKKTTIIAIAVSLVAVLVVVIGFTALKDFFMPVHVQEINFKLGENDMQYKIDNNTFDGDTLKLCVDDMNSFQLTWEILPENAENKKVTFSSNNEKFTVNENGLVSFSEKDQAAVITVKTEDGEKTDQIAIQTYSNQAANAGYDFETNTFEASSDYFVKDGDLYLYNGTTYEFILDYNVSFAKQGTDTTFLMTNEENVYTVTPSQFGTGKIVASCNGQTKDINVWVVEKVIAFNLTNQEFNQDYQVGNKNAFTFPISVSTSTGNPIGGTELTYYLENDEQQQEFCPFEGVTMLTGMDLLEPDVYTFTISSTYDIAKKLSVTFTVNDGVNVTSHQEMSLYYNDESIKTINLVKDYTIAVDDLKTDPARDKAIANTPDGQTPPDPINLVVTSTNDDQKYLNPGAKFIYYRTTALTLNGNGHTVDAHNVPRLEQLSTELGHNRCILFGCGDYTKTKTSYYSQAMSTTNPTLTIAQVLNSDGVLNAEDIATQKEYVLSLYQTAEKFAFNDMEVVGNLVSDDYLSTQILGSEGYTGLIKLNAFGLNSADVTFDNVNIHHFLMGIMQANYSNGSFALTIKDSTISDTFVYNVFTLSTAKIKLENSTFEKAGHACIYNKSIDSGKYIDKYTDIDTTQTNESEFKTKVVGDLTFNNWIDIDECTPALKFDNNDQVINGLYNILNQTLGTNYISNVVKTDAGKNYINFGMMHEAITSSSAKDYPQMVYDFTDVENYNEGYNKDSYWTAFGAVYGGSYTQEQVYAGIIEPQSYVNDKIICVAINAKLAMSNPLFADTNSYFYLGRNVL